MDREPQGQDMVPTVTISDIAGLGHVNLLKHMCSLFVFVPHAEYVCVYMHVLVSAVCMCVCVCVCVCPAQGICRDEGNSRRGVSNRKRRHERPQSEGGLSPDLCSDPVQEGNEERMASDNSQPWLQISAIRPITKHTHHFYIRSTFIHVAGCVWSWKRWCMV